MKLITLDNLSKFTDNVCELIDSTVNSAIGNKSDVGHDHDEIYYTKSEVDALLSNCVSLETVRQMIADALANLDNPIEPPIEPEPDEPAGEIGTITNDNSIVIDETLLENGTYTLKYIDSNENVIDDFNEIVTFEINN